MMEGVCLSPEHSIARQRLMYQSWCVREVTDIIQVQVMHEAGSSHCFSYYLTC